jgi:hypothetical protein
VGDMAMRSQAEKDERKMMKIMSGIIFPNEH